MPWHNEVLQSHIDKVILDSKRIESFEIKIGNYWHIITSEVISELFSRIFMQDIHPDGFKQITFKQFGNLVEELDQSVFERLVNLS